MSLQVEAAFASSGLGQLFCLGMSHRCAPVSLREAVYVDSERLANRLGLIKRSLGLAELVVLSTCNRIEVFGVDPSYEFGHHDVLEAFRILAEGGSYPLCPVSLLSHTYFLCNSDAVDHAFRVAASLDSMVLGEPQITGQFRQAIKLAREHQTLGPVLDRLSNDAFRSVKKIRSRTDLGTGSVSVSSVAIDLARTVFGDLKDRRFLFVGAGEMIRLAALHAANFSLQALIFANRTRQRAEELAKSVATGRAVSFEALEDELRQSDVVLTCTGSTEPLLDHRLLSRVMRARKERPLFVVDIALPRDVEASCGDLENVFLFDLDDLRRLSQQNSEQRKSAVASAEEYIEEGQSSFHRWLLSQLVRPTIVDLSQYLERLLQQELGRTLRQSPMRDLDESQKECLRQLLRSLQTKLAGDAAQWLKRAGPGIQTEISAILAEGVRDKPVSKRSEAPRLSPLH